MVVLCPGQQQQQQQQQYDENEKDKVAPPFFQNVEGTKDYVYRCHQLRTSWTIRRNKRTRHSKWLARVPETSRQIHCLCVFRILEPATHPPIATKILLDTPKGYYGITSRPKSRKQPNDYAGSCQYSWQCGHAKRTVACTKRPIHRHSAVTKLSGTSIERAIQNAKSGYRLVG